MYRLALEFIFTDDVLIIPVVAFSPTANDKTIIYDVTIRATSVPIHTVELYHSPCPDSNYSKPNLTRTPRSSIHFLSKFSFLPPKELCASAGGCVVMDIELFLARWCNSKPANRAESYSSVSLWVLAILPSGQHQCARVGTDKKA